ncbi:hypothetical protein QJQ45_021814 [Haematococcus lacustris]|nr:hypothetical protein QJQ45_021814 [Haematococcus lacustris]
MNSGFGNALVSKGLLLCCSAASVCYLSLRSRLPVLYHATQATHTRTAWLQSLCGVFVFRTPGELLFGSFLLYTFRIIERQLGSRQFASFAVLAQGLSLVLLHGSSKLLRVIHRLTSSWTRLPRQPGPVRHLLLRRWLSSVSSVATAAGSTAAGIQGGNSANGNSLLAGPAALVGGPYGLLFASFVHFFLDVPASSRFSLLGLRLSDKVFVYLTGAQLLLTGGRGAAMAAAAGLVAGCLYRSPATGLRQFRIPGLVTRLAARFLRPLLASTPSSLNTRPPGDISGGHGSSTRGLRQAGAAAAGQATARYPPAAGSSISGSRTRGPGLGLGPGLRERVGANQAGAAATRQPLALDQGAGSGLQGGLGNEGPMVVEAAVEQLMAMGFGREEAQAALTASGNDVQAAIALLV